MIFSPKSIEAILEGRKTVTRREAVPGKPCRYQSGRTYAVQPGRGKKAVARIRIRSVQPEAWFGYYALGDMDREARREGFETWSELCAAWCKLNPKAHRNGKPTGPNVWIWFELVKEAPRGS